MKLHGSEHLLLMPVSFSLLIAPTFPLEILIFPSYVPTVTCQPSQEEMGFWLKQRANLTPFQETEVLSFIQCSVISKRNSVIFQNFRDAPGWTFEMLQMSQLPFLKLANYSVFPLGSPSYPILFQMPFSHCISQKLLLFH